MQKRIALCLVQKEARSSISMFVVAVAYVFWQKRTDLGDCRVWCSILHSRVFFCNKSLAFKRKIYDITLHKCDKGQIYCLTYPFYFRGNRMKIKNYKEPTETLSHIEIPIIWMNSAWKVELNMKKAEERTSFSRSQFFHINLLFTDIRLITVRGDSRLFGDIALTHLWRLFLTSCFIPFYWLIYFIFYFSDSSFPTPVFVTADQFSLQYWCYSDNTFSFHISCV